MASGYSNTDRQNGSDKRDVFGDAQQGAEQRGEALGDLAETTGNLRDKLRLQAEMARAIREKEEQNYHKKKGMPKFFKRKKKGRNNESNKENEPEDLEEDSEDEWESEKRPLISHGGGASRYTTENNREPSDIRAEDVSGEVLRRDRIMDRRLNDMDARAEELARAGEVFNKNPKVEVVGASRKRRQTCILAVVLVCVVLTVGVVLTVLFILKPWKN